MSNRVLLLSWEYPPVIEGGLARHVRKLAEALVRQGVEVDVLTRGLAGCQQDSRCFSCSLRTETSATYDTGRCEA